MKMRNQVVFYLNGERHEAGGEQSKMMLADYLRYSCRMTGTKVVCAEGDCGACSVLRLDPKTQEYVPINSCIITVAQLDGSSVVTIEALNQNTEKLSAPQSAMINCHASQCGFCTPGFVVALTGAIEKKICGSTKKATCEKLTAQEAKNAFTGNLCRCTGYQAIIDAATSVEVKKCETVKSRFCSKAQETDLKKIRSQPLLIKGKEFSIFAPTRLSDAAKYLGKNKDAMLIGAGTDLGVVSNKGKLKLQKLLSLHLVDELYLIKTVKAKAKNSEARVTVGARVTLSELRNLTKELVPEFSSFLDIFASPQIKNVATLIGNVGNASPIADTPPFLLVSDAVVHVMGSKGKRKIPITAFYLDYRKTALKPGEFISSIDFSIPGKGEQLKLYKASQRKDLDISAVNAAFKMKRDKNKIKSLALAMGGVAATPIRLLKTEKFLVGTVLNEENLAAAVAILHSEMAPLSDVRGTSTFRRVLVENLFLKFFRSQIEVQMIDQNETPS